MTQSKAKRTKIRIGGIEVNAYLLPDGRTVKLAGRNVLEVVGYDGTRSLVHYWGVKSLKQLPHADLSLGRDGTIKSTEGESFIPVAVEDVIPFWNKNGGEIGKALVEALAIESIERRVYNSLGIEVAEEEIDQRVRQRVFHLKSYHPNFTYWGKADGLEEGREYAERIKRLKAQIGLDPSLGVDEMAAEDLDKMNRAEHSYHILRRTGLSHDESLRYL